MIQMKVISSGKSFKILEKSFKQSKSPCEIEIKDQEKFPEHYIFFELMFIEKKINKKLTSNDICFTTCHVVDNRYSFADVI
jgi:hypothetical protein